MAGSKRILLFQCRSFEVESLDDMVGFLACAVGGEGEEAVLDGLADDRGGEPARLLVEDAMQGDALVTVGRGDTAQNLRATPVETELDHKTTQVFKHLRL